MSKIDRKRKRSATKPPANLPELAPTKKRQPNGDLRRDNNRPSDPRKTALEARVRQFGGKETRQRRSELSGPHMGAQIGMVLEALCNARDVSQLWQTFAAWSAAEDTYRKRYLGRTESPTGAAIAMVPDKMEADDGHTIDTRDADQKDADAVRNWMRWQGHLGRLDAQERTDLQQARLSKPDAPLWMDRQPTPRGLRAYRALTRLHNASAHGR